jgi:type II secretory pathway component PulF
VNVTYTAKSKTGQMTAGTVDAASLPEARQLLRAQGLFPLTLTEGKKTAGTSDRVSRGPFRRRRVSRTDLLMVTSQLSIMCRAGLDLAEGLKNVANQCTNQTLRLTMEEVYEDVSSGKLVSAALGRHPDVFNSAYVASIAAAEASGEVTDILARLADLQRNEIRLRSSIIGILAYPIILIVVASVVIVALVFFVLPQFATIFEDMERPAPPLTQMLLGGAQFLREHVIVFLACAGTLLAALVVVSRTEKAARFRDSLVLHLAAIRGATRALVTGRVFRIMGSLLQSGIPLLEAIRLCRTSTNNRLYQELFVSLEQDVINGSGIGNALSATEFVPPGAAQMVMTAEQTGRLGPVMQTVGEFFEDDGERRLRQLVKLLEPAIIVAMGVVVACVVLTVILPLLDVTSMAE